MVNEHRFVGLQVGLDGLDSGELDRDPLGVQSAEVPIVCQALANLQYLNVAVGKLPNLAFGNFLHRHLLLWFHSFSSVGDVDNPAKIKTPCLGLFNGQCNDLAYSINPKGKNLERHQRSSSATMTRSAREAIACAASLSVVRAAKCS